MKVATNGFGLAAGHQLIAIKSDPLEGVPIGLAQQLFRQKATLRVGGALEGSPSQSAARAVPEEGAWIVGGEVLDQPLGPCAVALIGQRAEDRLADETAGIVREALEQWLDIERAAAGLAVMAAEGVER